MTTVPDLREDSPDEYPMLVPILAGGIKAASGPSVGTSGRGDVQCINVEAVAPGTWISLSLVAPAVGIVEAEAVGALNLTGDEAIRINFHDAIVTVDGAEVSARAADHHGRRLVIVDGADYTVSLMVQGSFPIASSCRRQWRRIAGTRSTATSFAERATYSTLLAEGPRIVEGLPKPAASEGVPHHAGCPRLRTRPNAGCVASGSGIVEVC
jgi:hypothetical protein